MAKTRYTPYWAERPSSEGRFIVDTYRGQTRIRSWPRKAGKATNPVLIATQDMFRRATRLMKYVAPSQFAAAIEQAKFNGVYPRDVLGHYIMGGGYNLLLPDGRILKSAIRYLEETIFQGARVQRNATQAIAPSTLVTLNWQVPILDTAFVWDAAQPSRLTVPANVAIVTLKSAIRTTTTSVTYSQISIYKNGTLQVAATGCDNDSNIDQGCDTGPIPVVAGDYFQAKFFSTTLTTIANVPKCFFSMEIIGTTP